MAREPFKPTPVACLCDRVLKSRLGGLRHTDPKFARFEEKVGTQRHVGRLFPGSSASTADHTILQANLYSI